MALKDLFFSIFAKDKTGDAFRGLNRKLRETEGHAASLSERLNRTGKSMVKFGAAGSVATAGIVAAFRDSVGLYDTQARAEAKVTQAIKATGAAAGFSAAELFKQASAMQAVTRLGDEDILNKVTAQLLTFKEISGDTFERAQWAAADLATTLDGDLQGAAIMLGKALNDPIKGLSAMGKAGVTFSEEQKSVIKSLAETGQIAAAQKVILDEIASAYGGQAQAAALAGAGVVQQWNNTWGDIKEIVGGVLVEGMKAALPVLQSVANAFQSLNPETQRFVVVAGALGVALPPIIGAVGLLVIGVGAISAPVLAAVAGVAALTAGLVAFWPQVSAAAGYLRGLWDDLTLVETAFAPLAIAVRAAWDVFANAFPNIAQLVRDTVSGIVEAIQGRFLSVMDAIGAKVDWVEGKFAWLYDKVVGNSWVPDLVEEIGQSFAMLQGNMVDPTDAATGKANDAFKGLADNVSGSLSRLAMDGELTWGNFLGAMEDTAQRQVDSIVTNVFDQLTTAGVGALSGVFSSALGGASGGGGIGATLGGIASSLLGFDTGGAFTVRGRAGTDRNVAAVRLSEGEDVEVTRRGQRSGGVNLTMNITTPDAASFRKSRSQVAGEMRRGLALADRAS